MHQKAAWVSCSLVSSPFQVAPGFLGLESASLGDLRPRTEREARDWVGLVSWWPECVCAWGVGGSGSPFLWLLTLSLFGILASSLGGLPLGGGLGQLLDISFLQNSWRL